MNLQDPPDSLRASKLGQGRRACTLAGRDLPSAVPEAPEGRAHLASKNWARDLGAEARRPHVWPAMQAAGRRMRACMRAWGVAFFLHLV